MVFIDDTELARLRRAAAKVEGSEAMAQEHQSIAERQRRALFEDHSGGGSVLEAAVHAADVDGQARDEQAMRSYVRRNPDVAQRPTGVAELSRQFGRASLEAIHRTIQDANNGGLR